MLRLPKFCLPREERICEPLSHRKERLKHCFTCRPYPKPKAPRIKEPACSAANLCTACLFSWINKSGTRIYAIRPELTSSNDNFWALQRAMTTDDDEQWDHGYTNPEQGHHRTQLHLARATSQWTIPGFQRGMFLSVSMRTLLLLMTPNLQTSK